MRKEQKSPEEFGEEGGSPQWRKSISRRSLLAGAAALGAGSRVLKAAGGTGAAGWRAGGARADGRVAQGCHHPDALSRRLGPRGRGPSGGISTCKAVLPPLELAVVTGVASSTRRAGGPGGDGG